MDFRDEKDYQVSKITYTYTPHTHTYIHASIVAKVKMYNRLEIQM